MSRARSCKIVHAPLERDLRDEQHPIGERRGSNQAETDERQERKANERSERARRSGRHDHFRRRRFAGRQGRCQRVASRQRRRDRKR